VSFKSRFSVTVWVVVFSVFVGGEASRVQADESAPTDVSTPPAKEPQSGSKRLKKGKRVREKEAEGTEAADRFEAHTVIKSKYSLNGESLEVDPD
jgi:hypothetical protein